MYFYFSLETENLELVLKLPNWYIFLILYGICLRKRRIKTFQKFLSDCFCQARKIIVTFFSLPRKTFIFNHFTLGGSVTLMILHARRAFENTRKLILKSTVAI